SAVALSGSGQVKITATEPGGKIASTEVTVVRDSGLSDPVDVPEQARSEQDCRGDEPGMDKPVDETPIDLQESALVSITIHPGFPVLAEGTARQFSAKGWYSDASDNDLTTVTWSSSDSKVLSIDSDTGHATACREGTATVTAKHEPSNGEA